MIFNHGIGDGTKRQVFPSDIINGEMCAPPIEGHNPWRTVEGTKYYLPYEYEPCSQQRGAHVNGAWDYPGASWFTFGTGQGFAPSRPLSAEFLYKRIRSASDRGASNILLSCAPDHTGSFRKDDIEQLVKLGEMLKNPALAPPMPITYCAKATSSGEWSTGGYSAAKAFDDSSATRWANAEETKTGWLEVELRQPAQFSKITISEGWDRIQKFELQIEKDGQWRTIHEGTTIGNDYSATFKPVSAQRVRLNILEATDVPTIWELQLVDGKEYF